MFGEPALEVIESEFTGNHPFRGGLDTVCLAPAYTWHSELCLTEINRAADPGQTTKSNPTPNQPNLTQANLSQPIDRPTDRPTDGTNGRTSSQSPSPPRHGHACAAFRALEGAPAARAAASGLGESGSRVSGRRLESWAKDGGSV